MANQERTKGGPGPSDDEMADMAKAGGHAGRTSPTESPTAGQRSTSRIWKTPTSGTCSTIDMLDTGTPTVYDPDNDEKIDIFDNDWLTKLISPDASRRSTKWRIYSTFCAET